MLSPRAAGAENGCSRRISNHIAIIAGVVPHFLGYLTY
jgi:hypothetical protein